ncbi:hypothetical protein AFCDBAGC_5182 [Methylobacterium cerastii]|uniref:Uncharacterized protein n=1 Tax=Methylobacterium cerastii TaxID=932741 RepID=A0ABQ4QQI6_9HYPH|nr:hypothetical protein [Methylobacterium cerastii]GJD47289.1 hypothetical protein AFCDBAGC_5182 [Methylobacterium cerastii]
MTSIEGIAATMRSIVTPGMKPKEIRSAIREKHPEASKKDIVRAAFYALTEAPVAGTEALADLHHFALTERGADEGADVILKASKRKRKKRSADALERPAKH